MARKNARSAGSGEVLLFDSRTKAVMAKGAPQDGIREKMQAVREFVPDFSNNQIILVLKHYDDDVEKTIHAFIEGHAKDVLQEWQQTGNKNPPKKKRKGRNKAGGGVEEMSSSDMALGETSSSDMALGEMSSCDMALGEMSSAVALSSDSLEAGASSHPDTTDTTPSNRDATSQSHSRLSSAMPTSQGPTSSVHTPAVRTPAVKSTNFTGDNQDGLTGLPAATCEINATEPTGSLSPTTVSLSALSLDHTPPMQEQPQIISPPDPVLSNQEVEPKVQKSHASQPTRPKQLDVSKLRERTLSEVSHSSDKSHRNVRASLEKSSKDLQRQNLTLQRLKTNMAEHLERDYKQIASLFEELRRSLNDREAEILYEMDKAKHQATECLNKRQLTAGELRVKIDRAGSMKEEQVAELRADIKHFVSERKIDEDIGSTNRFVCNAEEVTSLVRGIGRVVPVKKNYTQRRASVSSITSSITSHDDLFSPTSPAIHTPVHKDVASVKVLTQSDSLTQYETARPLNAVKPAKSEQTRYISSGHSSKPPGKLGQQGIHGNKTSRPTADREDGLTASEKKSRSARRRQKERERVQSHHDSGRHDHQQSRQDNQHRQHENPQGGQDNQQRYYGNRPSHHDSQSFKSKTLDKALVSDKSKGVPSRQSEGARQEEHRAAGDMGGPHAGPQAASNQYRKPYKNNRTPSPRKGGPTTDKSIRKEEPYTANMKGDGHLDNIDRKGGPPEITTKKRGPLSNDTDKQKAAGLSGRKEEINGHGKSDTNNDAHVNGDEIDEKKVVENGGAFATSPHRVVVSLKDTGVSLPKRETVSVMQVKTDGASEDGGGQEALPQRKPRSRKTWGGGGDESGGGVLVNGDGPVPVMAQ